MHPALLFPLPRLPHRNNANSKKKMNIAMALYAVLNVPVCKVCVDTLKNNGHAAVSHGCQARGRGTGLREEEGGQGRRGEGGGQLACSQ